MPTEDKMIIDGWKIDWEVKMKMIHNAIRKCLTDNFRILNIFMVCDTASENWENDKADFRIMIYPKRILMFSNQLIGYDSNRQMDLKYNQKLMGGSSQRVSKIPRR